MEKEENRRSINKGSMPKKLKTKKEIQKESLDALNQWDSSAAPEPKDYHAVVRFGDAVSEADGNSPIDALLKVKWEKPHFKAIITISKGDKRWEILNRPMYFKRLLGSPTLQQIFNAQVTKILQ